ncbi:MAG TPA: hypothetical protein VLQ93_10495 [Myxococcaceae bacterium]|nr:hypothetical protein [Myxococcaceae bacterium]
MNLRILCVLSSLVVLPSCGVCTNPDTPSPCTELVNGGADIPETAGIVFFEPMGGAIAEGTYHLTKFEIFPPGTVDPYVRRHALRVTGNRIEVVTQKNGGEEVRRSGTFSTSGSTVSFTIDCPQPETHIFGYSASDTQFQHVITGPDIKEVHTYTRQ